MDPIPLPPGYTIRPFRPEDVTAFLDYRPYLMERGINPDRYLERLAEGDSYTICKDRFPVACGGLTVSDRNEDMAWFLPSDDVRAKPKLYLKLCRQFFALVEQQDTKRIVATTEDGPGANWLQHCGFHPIGLRQVYDDWHLLYERMRG